MQQTKIFTFSCLITSLLSATCFASLPLKGELPIEPSHHWTGFYAGLNLGAMNHTLDITDNQAATFDATIEQVSDPRFSAGFQLGYRRQMDFTPISGVYGIELSANFSNATFTQQYGSPFALYQMYAKNQAKNPWLLQLIAGIAANRTFLFLAAGLSDTQIRGNFTDNSGSPFFFNTFTLNKTEMGTAIGGGVEYAITDKISLRFKLDVISPDTYTVYDSLGDSYSVANRIVQGTLGLNYTFA